MVGKHLKKRLKPLYLVAMLSCVSPAAFAASTAPHDFSEQTAQCGALFSRYERLNAIPHHLLRAVAMTESGRSSPDDGRVHPWPWAVNANGKGYYFDNKEQAVAAVRSWMKQGVRSVDVGCMQVSLLYHGQAFDSIDRAFDPEANVAYAAQFLRSHYDRTQSWRKAVAAYHSQTPELGQDYAYKVVRHWYGLVANRNDDRALLAGVSPREARDDWAYRNGAAAVQVANAATRPVVLPNDKPIEVSAANAENRVFQDSGQDLVKAVLAEKRGAFGGNGAATLQMVNGKLVNIDHKQPVQVPGQPMATPAQQVALAQQMPVPTAGQPAQPDDQPPAVADAPHMDGVWQIKKPIPAGAVPLQVMQPQQPYAYAVPMQPTYPVAPRPEDIYLGMRAMPQVMPQQAMQQPQAAPPQQAYTMPVPQAAPAEAQMMPAVAQFAPAGAAPVKRQGSLALSPNTNMVFRY